MSKHKVTDAPYGIRLIATSGEELANMLAVLSVHAKQHPTLTDQAKEFRAQRDEALATAEGWKRSAEMRNDDYVTLAQHCESITQQLEATTRALNASRVDRDEIVCELAAVRNARDRLRDEACKERDDLSELSEGQKKEILKLRALLREANAKLNRVTSGNGAADRIATQLHPDAQCPVTDQYGDPCEHKADHRSPHRSRHGEFGRQTALLHPDEDPRDHDPIIHHQV